MKLTVRHPSYIIYQTLQIHSNYFYNLSKDNYAAHFLKWFNIHKYTSGFKLVHSILWKNPKIFLLWNAPSSVSDFNAQLKIWSIQGFCIASNMKSTWMKTFKNYARCSEWLSMINNVTFPIIDLLNNFFFRSQWISRSENEWDVKEEILDFIIFNCTYLKDMCIFFKTCESLKNYNLGQTIPYRPFLMFQLRWIMRGVSIQIVCYRYWSYRWNWISLFSLTMYLLKIDYTWCIPVIL